ncbi:MAG: DUF6435 family protein [Candidatus Aenigmatarchaeota archaeon]
MQLLPYQEIFIWAVGLSVLTLLISKFLGNQQEIKKARKEMEFYREKAMKAQKSGDIKKANEYTSEMLKASQRQFRHNLRPMMVSFFVFLIALGWLNTSYAGVKIISPIPIPFLGYELGWLWWYIIVVLPMSMLFRKMLDVA